MHRYTQSADIWAFGIIMLELATGAVPRKGMGFVSLVMQTVHGDVPSLADAATKRTYSKVGITCLSDWQTASVAIGEDSEDISAKAVLCEPACHMVGTRQLSLHMTGVCYVQAMHDFTARCLDKNPSARMTPGELLKHPFLERARDNVYLAHRLLGAAPQQQLRSTRRSSDSLAPDSEVRLLLLACCLP